MHQNDDLGKATSRQELAATVEVEWFGGWISSDEDDSWAMRRRHLVSSMSSWLPPCPCLPPNPPRQAPRRADGQRSHVPDLTGEWESTFDGSSPVSGRLRVPRRGPAAVRPHQVRPGQRRQHAALDGSGEPLVFQTGGWTRPLRRPHGRARGRSRLCSSARKRRC